MGDSRANGHEERLHMSNSEMSTSFDTRNLLSPYLDMHWWIHSKLP